MAVRARSTFAYRGGMGKGHDTLRRGGSQVAGAQGRLAEGDGGGTECLPAYLSALEHGKRGLPTFDLLQRIAGYFNIIWDEAEELFLLARSSDPRVVIDTSGLPPNIPNLPTGWLGGFATLTARR